MALNNRGTIVDINSGELPSGYTKPSVTTMTEEYKRNEILSIAKSGVDDPDDVTTFEALVTQINTDVSAIATADYDTVGLTVDVYTRLKVVTTNANLLGVLYTDGVVNYLCTIEIYIATS